MSTTALIRRAILAGAASITALALPAITARSEVGAFSSFDDVKRRDQAGSIPTGIKRPTMSKAI